MNADIRRVLRTARSITLTPVSHKEDNLLSRIDYANQLRNYANGLDMIWDDAKSNDSQVGDLFGFVSGAGTDVLGEGWVRIHRIVAILPSSARDDSWSDEARRARGVKDIPDHDGRNVVVLSEMIGEFTWVELNRVTGRANDGWGKVLRDGRVMTPPLQGTKRWSI